MERRDYVAKPTSAAIIDSQTVKTTEKGGYGAGKKVKGRKRQIPVDTQGNLLKAHVHPADESDNVGGKPCWNV